MCFIEFPISGLGEPNIYQNLGDLTRRWGFDLEGVDSIHDDYGNCI